MCAGKKYSNLVLEGGGVRGFAYVGASEVLDSLGILQQIERVGGTSAGAIQATLLAVGYTPAEMKKIAADIPLKDFNDGFFASGFSRMKKRFGFFKGEKITEWMNKLIEAKTGDRNITFAQLHTQKQAKNYKDLYITGTDLTYRTLRTFSFEQYPGMRIADALRISFSIPLYFEPVLIDDSGHVRKDRANGTYHLMVDGGLLSNYPIQLFDAPRYMDDTSNSGLKINPKTLGLLLDKPQQLQYAKGGVYPSKISTLHDYFRAVYESVIDKPNPDEPSLTRTVTISHLNLPGRVRKLKLSTINHLVESGKAGIRLFFDANGGQYSTSR
ncbi:patatin-like phospholipase family protein [Segetibacter sp. 3557_3]|uniref:patatin-like phospholipase family protein n=1 Tax=Segetibacter sp. 3557_3 TaxID=2547429 RepID=UPI0014051773|nr:patatin-like phospholipase family protein [Segetibacter sp. 3557_3]